MEDRCVHRAYPLSNGRRDGDRVVCGYHGFTYDPSGCLIEVPSQENVPPGARVRSFQIREQSPFIWIWLGEPGLAALHPPPRVPWSDQGWATSGETLRIEANLLLLHEHYLDLTNVFVMYPEAAPPDINSLPPLEAVEVSETSVSYSRELPPTRPAAWEVQSTGLSVDSQCARREQGTFVSPALHVQRYVIDPQDRHPYELLRVQAFTPESSTATHVFLQVARNFSLDRDGVGEYLQAMFHQMAQRDAAVLQTVQSRLNEEEPRRDTNVKADRAAVWARRIITEMVGHESGRVAPEAIPTAAGDHHHHRT